MTINQLHRILTKEIGRGNGRRKVLVHKDAFTHPLKPDGLSYHDVTRADVETHTVLDADGFTKTRRDGTECLTTSLILRGLDDFCA